jgi:hypothetical protein
LEAAGSQTGPDGDAKDARPALRKQIEARESLEEADDDAIMDWVERTCLERKGILVLGWASGKKVRAILKKKEFGCLSQEVSTDSLIGLMAQNGDYFDWTKTVWEIAGKIEQETARDVVKEVGLDWPEGEPAIRQASHPGE